jgi:hypothetical protein
VFLGKHKSHLDKLLEAFLFRQAFGEDETGHKGFEWAKYSGNLNYPQAPLGGMG